MLKELLGGLVRARRRSDPSPYYDPADLARRLTKKARELQSQGYIDYPVLVHLETRAVCNAACSFPVSAYRAARWTDKRAIRRAMSGSSMRSTYTTCRSCARCGRHLPSRRTTGSPCDRCTYLSY